MTNGHATPTMTRRRIGALLRRYRIGAEMASKDAARAAGLDPTRIGRIEQGRYRITPEQITALMSAYGVDDEGAREELCRAAQEPPNAGWWTPYRTHLTTAYADFIALESDATSLRVQHPVVIPGLLQCPSYARAMLESSIHPPTRERADTLFAVRMGRQQIINRPGTPVRLHAVVPEAAFRARFETPTVIREQARHLLTLSEQENVTIQVLLLESPPNFGMYQAGTLLEFRHPWPAALSFDNWRGGSITEDADEVAAMETHFDQLSKIALSAEDSAEFLENQLQKG
ncbi:helix-turn-helix transcriptional regulator [Streptomyces sp. NPDC047049]|uniref:helix-turn-helix domain-containing protein n=1 Tax=Streptomyces sp. NPDC047049 TaxID=3156688 RepID=UPI0034016C80